MCYNDIIKFGGFKMKKIVAIVLLAVMCISALVACTPATVTNIDAKIIGYNNEVIFEGKVVVTTENPVVLDVLKAMELYENIESLEVGEGNTLTINGITTQATDDGKGFYFWSYKLNDVSEDATVEVDGTVSNLLVGIGAQSIKDGDKVHFVYTYSSIE